MLDVMGNFNLTKNFGNVAQNSNGKVLFGSFRPELQVSSQEVERGGRGGLMVSALYSGSGGPGLRPGQGTALCSWARLFILTVPLSTHVYKWVPANLLLGGNPAMD